VTRCRVQTLHRLAIEGLRDRRFHRLAMSEAPSSASRPTDHRASGLPDTLKPLARNSEVPGDPDYFSNRPRRAETSQRSARAAKNPLHPRVCHGDDVVPAPHGYFAGAGPDSESRGADFGRALPRFQRRGLAGEKGQV
jgi:hypothetical protein